MTIKLSSKSGGEQPPTALLNTPITTDDIPNDVPGIQVLSGALTADTYPGTPQVSITGKGIANIAGAFGLDATIRTITLKIIIDGVEVIEHGDTLPARTNVGFLAIGMYTDGFAGSFDQIPFSTSFQLFLKSDLTETDKSELIYLVRTI